jgi:hypothetical protein
MPTSEMREFITGLIASLTEKLDDFDAPEAQAPLTNEVTLLVPEGGEKRFNLATAPLGTVVRIGLAEYMFLVGENWIRYTGEKYSTEDFAELIRDEQKEGADVRLVHVG